MKLVLDCHCHTLASGHAYSTIDEYAMQAAKNGLELIAITDHAPAMPGTCHRYYFDNLRVLPEVMHGVRILKGVELNIIDYDGSVDLPDSVIMGLELVIASLHLPCFKTGNVEQNTNALIGAMKNPYIHIIGHPDDSRIPIDVKRLVEAASKNNIILELNNSSLRPTAFRVNAVENYRALLTECIKHNVSIIVNTDSHVHTDVGCFEQAINLLCSLDFPQELIINTSVDRLFDVISSNSI